MTKLPSRIARPSSRCVAFLAVGFLCSSGFAGIAQTPTRSDATANGKQSEAAGNGSCAASFSYSVASIRQHKSSDHYAWMRGREDGLSAVDMTLWMLVKSGYQVRDEQILNAPQWVKSEGYDIEAKIDGPELEVLQHLGNHEDSSAHRCMLQALLENRFGLELHHESKRLPVYVLVVAKGGPKLDTATACHCGDQQNSSPGSKKEPPDENRSNTVFTGQPIETLANYLSERVGRTVINDTGIQGKHDFKLWYDPNWDSMQGSGEHASSSPAGPSIFTALQDQLGLKLTSEKRQVDVIVIDHVEQPSPN